NAFQELLPEQGGILSRLLDHAEKIRQIVKRLEDILYREIDDLTAWARDATLPPLTFRVVFAARQAVLIKVTLFRLNEPVQDDNLSEQLGKQLATLSFTHKVERA